MTDLNAAELDFLSQQAVDAAGVVTHLEQAHPNKIREYVSKIGFVETTIERPRLDRVDTLDDLVAVVGMQQMRDGVGDGEVPRESSIWVGRPNVPFDFRTLRLVNLDWLRDFKVDYLVDDGERMRVVRVPLTVSPWVQALFFMVCGDVKPMRHDDFLQWLERVGSVEEIAAVLKKLAKISAATGNRTESDVSFGKQRGRAEFERELIGADEVPEEIEFAGEFFTDPASARCRFVCKINPEIRSDGVVFSLRLSSQAIEATVSAVATTVRDYLAGKQKTLVFLGDPWKVIATRVK